MEDKNAIGICIIVLVIGIFFGAIFGDIILKKEQEIIYKNIEVEKEQPMLLVVFDSWGENIDDSSESILSYNILNFGTQEAKNVIIKCEVSDFYDNILKEEIFNIGNIASTSYEYQESIMKYSSNSLEEYGSCYVDSADGEYINLLDRLEDFE